MVAGFVFAKKSIGSDFGWIVPLPFVFYPIHPLNSSGLTIYPVTIDYGIGIRISAACSVVQFAKNKFKVSCCCFFSLIGEALHRNAVRVNPIVIQGALKQSERSIFIQIVRVGAGGLW